MLRLSGSHPGNRLFRALSHLAALAAAFLLLSTTAAHAQTYNVIHNFTGTTDGGMPMAGLTVDRAGNLLGTANLGGNTGDNCGASGCGLVYKLANKNSSWILTPLYSFQGGNDGANPRVANVIIASDGTLYSSTFYGGAPCSTGSNGCGTIFKLQPQVSACASVICPWNKTILHNFTGDDGAGPVGALFLDQQGNVDGVTTTGGFRNGGSVFQLNASSGWMETIIFHPYGYPGSSVSPDHAGNLYGSTFIGNDSPGTIYQLTLSGQNWIGNDIYTFTGGSDGGYPQAGVIFDPVGNLYGATSAGGSGGGGTVFELSPSGGGWTYQLLYSFARPPNGRLVVGPVGNLVMDGNGNLYGTTISDGAHGYGAVFKLTPSNGNWSYTSLHDFTGGSDGGNPYCNLVFDAGGNIYGTASIGGAFGSGVIFQITP